MKFYNEKIVKKIREERRNGLSARDLEKKFKISNTTISRWIRDIDSDNTRFKNARKNRIEIKSEFGYLVDTWKLKKTDAKVFAGLLYWCEGSKYPSSNFVAFSNSDFGLVRTFLELLRLGFDLDENKVRIHLQIHTTHNEAQIINFWSKLLGVPKSKFYKSTITSPSHRMKRRDYKGTCTVRYYDVKLLFYLTGIFESFTKKI